MKRTAFLCPGQGAQRVGMGRDLCEAFPLARRTFAEANDALGCALDRLCFEGPEEELTATENAQPALLTHSVAIGRVLFEEGGIRPVIGAGHSLGEWSILVLAEALDLEQALRAVRSRGRFMQDAVPRGVGAMSALLGAPAAVVEDLCRAASTTGEAEPGEGGAGASAQIVVPANWNGAGQVVVAGHAAAVERLEALAKERKVRAMRLKVSAPFHSPLMEPARARMESVLASLTVRDPAFPVVANVDGVPNTHGDRLRDLLLAQITSAVRWEDCAARVAQACDRAIEVGAGRVLSGLLRRTAPDLPCLATDDVAGVRAVLAEAGS